MTNLAVLARGKVTIILIVTSIYLLLFGVSAGLKASAQVSLRFFCWGLGEDIWGSYLKEMKTTFEKENPNIKIQFELVTFGDKEKVFTVQSEAGKAPDVARFTFDPIRSFIARGYLLDLSPFIQKQESGFLEQWHSRAIAVMTHKGKVYALPEEFMPWVLLYNTKMFQEAGLSPTRPPEKWKEFVDYARKLTRDINSDGKVDQWGYGMVASRGPGLFPRFNPWLWSAGGDYLTPDETRSALDSPEALEGFKFYVELDTVHSVVPPGATGMGPHDVRTQLAYRQVAMITATGFDPGIVNGINPDLKAYEVLRMTPLPVGKIKATGASLGIWVISSGTKHPEEAWKLLKFLTGNFSQMAAFKYNGWVSARMDVAKSLEIQRDKYASVLAAQADYVKFPPLIPEWPKIGDLVTTALHNALTKKMTPEQALSEAHKEIDSFLSERYKK